MVDLKIHACLLYACIFISMLLYIFTYNKNIFDIDMHSLRAYAYLIYTVAELSCLLAIGLKQDFIT